MSIVIPGSGTILEMIRNRSMGSDRVTVKHPQNWYENNDLLGFALCCVYMPLDIYVDNGALSLECHLTGLRNNQSEDKDILSIFISSSNFYDDDDSESSYQLWVIYYPMDDIKEEYRSNEWTHFMASFYRDEIIQVKECGFHLIYSEEHQHNQDDEDHHMPDFFKRK